MVVKCTKKNKQKNNNLYLKLISIKFSTIEKLLFIDILRKFKPCYKSFIHKMDEKIYCYEDPFNDG